MPKFCEDFFLTDVHTYVSNLIFPLSQTRAIADNEMSKLKKSKIRYDPLLELE